jgi:hypothetical protein
MAIVPQDSTEPRRPLAAAGEGDILNGQDLSAAIAWLNGQADALNARKAGVSDEELTQIATTQSRLRGTATALNAASIEWIAGQAKIEAEHVQDALDYATGVIDKAASLKGKLDSLTAVLTFFSVFLTGSPAQIVAAGAQLRSDLDKAKSG